MDGWVWVNLSRPLVQFAEHIAQTRGKARKGSALTQKLNDKRDLVGALGEVAVAHHYNVPVQHEATVGGDGGRDFHIMGSEIDVKTSTYHNPDLLIRSGSVSQDKHYFLVYANPEQPERVGLVGHVSGKQAYSVGEWKQLRPDGPVNLVVSGSLLTRFREKQDE